MTPTELRALPYVDYLQTEHWQTMRRLALEASDGRCLLCDSAETLEVHHRTYERVGCEQLRDLVVLCESCHQRHHGLIDAAEGNVNALRLVEELHTELAAEMTGAAFLARQVELAWTDGVLEGHRRAEG